MVAQIDREYLDTAGPGATLRRAASYALFEGRPATTRGQWVNPAVRANLLLGKRIGGRTVDRPIFILGVGRSGTTHLGRLLSAHPEVAWLNEPKLLWHELVPDEDVSGFYSPHGRFVLEEGEATPQLRRTAQRVFGYYLSVVRGTRLVDKYPELTYRAAFLRALFPDCRLVAIVRRPEDFVNSVLDWNRSHASGNEDWWGVDQRKWLQYADQMVASDPEISSTIASLRRGVTDAEKAATEWVLGMRSVISANVDALVRFEHLATSPVAAMQEVLSVCELSPDRRVLSLAASATRTTLRASTADFGALTDAVRATEAVLWSA